LQQQEARAEEQWVEAVEKVDSPHVLARPVLQVAVAVAVAAVLAEALAATLQRYVTRGAIQVRRLDMAVAVVLAAVAVAAYLNA
jgi:hypothetical protein